jgi:7-keto-8-aminopelargonate synthetase-like enzyme
MAGEVLDLGLFDFKDPVGKDFSTRCEPFMDWVDAASREGYFQFLRHHVDAPKETTEVVGWGGQSYRGINLASQDYLGLARHPEVVRASAHAVLEKGTHSSGSETLGGGFGEAKRLERIVAGFTGHAHVVLFPTGWAAGYGAIRALVRPHDVVLMDALAHNCLQHGAQASTPNVATFAHNDLDSLEGRLRRARAERPDAAILVITESLFSMDSDHPDFERMIPLCDAYEAALMVDVAHDLGVLGPGGRGVLHEAGLLEKVPFLVGSFSKTFASIGGFFASRHRGPTLYARGFSGSYTFSNYLVPSQVAAVTAAFDIVVSEEGDELRRRALENATVLRDALAEHGVPALGRVSSLVLPVIGPEPVARIAYRYCLEHGLILNNIEFPACRRGAARFRMQVTPLHTADQMRSAARIVRDSLEHAEAVLRGDFCPAAAGIPASDTPITA